MFPAGATICYNAAISKIIAKNTPENLLKLKNVLDEINVATEQVSIETKFVEVSTNDLSEFGFDWAIGLNPDKRYHNSKFNMFDQSWTTPQDTSQLVPNGVPIPAGFVATTLNDLAPYYRGTTDAGGNFTPIYQTVPPTSAELGRLGNGLRGASTAMTGVNALDQVLGVRSILGSYQLDTILRAINQTGSSNMLAAPKVTAMSGNEAVIEMVQKRYFPTRWEAPNLNAQGGQNNNGNLQQNVSSTPSSPEFGEPTNIGVMLHVTPTVRDQFVINLKLKPEVVEFLGYDKELNQYGTLGNQPYLFKFEMPIIETRSVDTQVEINDGETLVLGGFIREDAEEFVDKIPYLGDIPVLGRLFQTKGSKNTKRNLLIFVTARLVKANGVPVRSNTMQGTIDFNR
jgi:general secretion pathway protein D